jgi:hypothetical protein
MRGTMKTLVLVMFLSFPSIFGAYGEEQKSTELPLFVTKIGEHENIGAPHIHFYPIRLKNNQTRLVIWGGVDQGDAARFREALEQVPKPISEILILGSPGGDLEEGLQIGRIIHQAKLAVRIPSDGICVSACNFIFLGGLIRTIEVNGKFIVHLFHSDYAPKAILIDMLEASQEVNDAPEPKPPASSVSAKSSLPADTVSNITSPKHLKSLGCDMNHIYTQQYDENVKKQEIALETGEDEDKVDLAKEKIEQPKIFAQLRALTIDYLCLEQTTAVAAAEIALFLVEMRMSLRFLTEFANIGNALPTPMTRDQLRSFNITNTE